MMRSSAHNESQIKETGRTTGSNMFTKQTPQSSPVVSLVMVYNIEISNLPLRSKLSQQYDPQISCPQEYEGLSLPIQECQI
jgi:hypothetical protein